MARFAIDIAAAFAMRGCDYPIATRSTAGDDHRG